MAIKNTEKIPFHSTWNIFCWIKYFQQYKIPIQKDGGYMNIANIDQEILNELRIVSGDKNLIMDDIFEYRSTPITPRESEELIFLPKLKLNVAFKRRSNALRTTA
jgi:hypothetical protein